MKIAIKTFDPDELECCYRNCRHKVKEHNGKKCKCKHIQNNISVGFEPKMVILF